MTRQSFLRWLLLALVAWPFAACGKKGKLEAPDDADPAASDVILPRIRQGH